MSDTEIVVDYLKKVTLALEAGTLSDDMDLTTIPIRFTFIFGVATDGINLFEKALHAGAVDDERVIDIQPGTSNEILGHLKKDMLSLLPAPPPFFLKVRITHIVQAENREVIQAMATSVSDCSGGGDCDCGCGCS